MNILDALRVKKGLTETESSIADYILNNVDGVTHMTISELSKSAHCSNSGIVRLCQKLGIDGYRELRIELARSVEQKRLVQMEVNPDLPFIEGDDTADIMSAIATLSKQAVDATRSSIHMLSIRRAARLILGARRVVYYAIGDSLVSAEMFANLLIKIGITPLDGFYHGDFGAIGQLMDARDVALIITHSGRMVATYSSIFEMLRSRGVRTVIVTSDPGMGERMMGTDCIVSLPQGESRSQRLATFYSQECIRFALNCIYAEAFSANYRENTDAWNRIVGAEGQAG